MKTLATLAALCLTAAFVGCQSTVDMGAVSPAAVSECGVNCEAACCTKACAPGCAKDCCADANMGAVGSPDCSGSGSVCPATGTSYGAVSDAPKSSDCGACPHSKTPGDA